MITLRNAPIFELPYINKEGTYSNKEDLGKVIVLTFWTSWCPDSGKDLPKKEQLYKTMDHEKVKMITINVEGRERSEAEAEEYAEKFLSQPALKDQGRTIYDLYNSDGVPTTVIINKDGFIHSQFGDKAEFLSVVESLGELI
ncbi:TlpA family protein disulfide reductase [Halobacillus halophilus]|uniref:TlpA family protein disulfide reductase n=1 Tax=Halobacillus halophilus TaxID=1570 RepID=UPI0037BED260